MEKNYCSSCCCGPKGALLVAGIIFGLMSLVHLYRIFYFFPVAFGTIIFPAQASVVAFIILGVLAIWMFWSAKKS